MGKNKKELIIENPLGLKHFDESLLIEIEKEINRQKKLLRNNYEDGKFIIDKELLKP